MEGATAGRAGDPDQTAQTGRRLITPAAMRRALPASPEARAGVGAARDRLRALLHGRDRARLAVIVGPFALHDPEGALDYARRLCRVAEGLADELVVVMRCSVGRPGGGEWTGLVNDPDRDGSCDVGLGLATARQLLRRIAELPLACAIELEPPLAFTYLEDLVACGIAGAAGGESLSQPLASAASLPVGFEPVGGGLDAALRALHAADPGAARTLLVDCAGGAANGDPRSQASVCRRVLAAWRDGAAELLGVTLRSYLEEGRQDARGRRLRYGVSVGDACIGWPETADLLRELADAVKRSR